MTSPSGVVIVDKPSAVTSHQVVGRLRRLLGTRKIGHAGTLDPMATGVLILGVNRATRLLGHLALHDKRYLATLRLGASSNTDDADGEVIPVADASSITRSMIDSALDAQRGDILQVPTSVSAIKVAGRRAYELARAGQAVELKPRPVTISSLKIISVRTAGPFVDVDLDVECSSGTYVRAIARDLGAALGVGGHLTALRRTRIGRYELADAVVLGEEPPPLMPMADAARLSFPVVAVTAEEATDIGFGRPIARAVLQRPTGMIGPDGRLLALYEPASSGARPLAVLV